MIEEPEGQSFKKIRHSIQNTSSVYKRQNTWIILEGPDCGGKTTLKQNLIKHLPQRFHSIHNSLYRSDYSAYEAYVHQANAFASEDCIFDRFYFSEYAYSIVMRDKLYDDAMQQLLKTMRKVFLAVNRKKIRESHKSRLNVFHILCRPNISVLVERWKERKQLDYEYIDKLNKYKELVSVYDTKFKDHLELSHFKYDSINHTILVYDYTLDLK